MKKSILALICALTFGAAHNAQAGNFFNSFDRVLDVVDRAESRLNRAENTADRLNDKIPEAGAETENTSPSRGAGTSTGITAEEQRILDRADAIEEKRVLREAEAIRSRSRRR